MIMTQDAGVGLRWCEIRAVRERSDESWGFVAIFAVWVVLAAVVWRLHVCRYGIAGFGARSR